MVTLVTDQVFFSSSFGLRAHLSRGFSRKQSYSLKWTELMLRCDQSEKKYFLTLFWHRDSYEFNNFYCIALYNFLHLISNLTPLDITSRVWILILNSVHYFSRHFYSNWPTHQTYSTMESMWVKCLAQRHWLSDPRFELPITQLPVFPSYSHPLLSFDNSKMLQVTFKILHLTVSKASDKCVS